MLSLGGASYQGVFRNPLVDPYLLGAAAGAGLGATLVFTVLRDVDARAGRSTRRRPWRSSSPSPPSFLTYIVGASFGGAAPGVTLVLAGVAMVVAGRRRSRRSCCSATSRSCARSTTWILGRLSTADVGRRAARPAVRRDRRRRAAAAPPSPRPAAGRRGRGVDARRARGACAARRGGAATLATAAVVSVSGLIGFVGIVVPHAVRLVAGSSYRRLLPLSLLFGARVPDPRRHPRARADRSGRDADRRRHRVPRRAVLHRHPAARRPEREPMSSLELREVGVAYGRRVALAAVQRPRRIRRVARADRAQRRRQVVVAAGGRRARRVHAATSLVDGVVAGAALPARGGPRWSPTCRRSRCSPTTCPASSTCCSGGRRTSATSAPRAATTRRWRADVLERLDLRRVRRSTARHAERRRAAAAGDRPCPRPGGADPAARRADRARSTSATSSRRWSSSPGCAAITG